MPKVKVGEKTVHMPYTPEGMAKAEEMKKAAKGKKKAKGRRK